VFVGDVHGCLFELEALLDAVRFTRHDRLVLVGDAVARGPDSAGVLKLLRRLRGVLVRGNHEEKLLRWRAARRAHALGQGKRPKPLGPVHEEVARALRGPDWVQLAASPLWVDFPKHGVRAVHAGVVPSLPFERQDKRTLLRIRTVSPDGDPEEKASGVLWGALYKGPPHIVFGHNAARAPQVHPWATGLDTSCVYGGRLTALVLEEGEPVPKSSRERRLRLVSVRARRVYYEGTQAQKGRRVA
jgi:diadenosine tetraphosphatase ApaH/serine/threonine PP2A family protein phosphatase